MTAMVIAFALLLTFAHVDRIVSSTGGKVITTEASSVFQALDASIIKSIDVKEGQRVEKGQLLATLDSTFAAADVKQLKEQIDSLDAQIAREDAELARREPVFAANADTDYGKYAVLQKQLFDQRAAQYVAQLKAMTRKSPKCRRRSTSLRRTKAHYKERRGDRQEDRGHAQHPLAKWRGVAAELAGLDGYSRIEALRTMEFGHNSLVEAQHQMSALKADREAFIQQWMSTTSQDLVTARNNRDAAAKPAREGSKASGPRAPGRDRRLLRAGDFQGQCRARCSRRATHS